MTETDLKKFFLSKLAPAKPQVLPFIPTSPDANRESYFVDPLVPEAVCSQADTITSLIEMWRGQGLDTLVALEPEIRKMAKSLRALGVQNDAVSSFIYAMY